MRFIRLKKSKCISISMIDEVTNHIEMKNFKLTYSLFSMPSADKLVDATKAQNAAYQKINFFIEDILDHSFAFTIESNKFAAEVMSNFSNNFVLLPSLTEISLLEALHSKLNVLAGDNSYVEELELEDLATEQTYLYIQDERSNVEYDLPDVDAFLGEYPLWGMPWWERYDITTTDNVVESEEEYIKFKEILDEHEVERVSRLVLDDIDAAIDDYFSEEREVGEVIDLEEMKQHLKDKEKWQPTLV